MTHAENHHDNRQLVPYHWGPDDPQVTAAQRWHSAVKWWRRYVRALAQPALRPAYPWSPAWYQAALCVHSGEGAWTADTGNGYTGGMQFDSGTWLSNGGGQFASEAYLATPLEQLLVAYRTWQSRGWSPWPTTAAACGLL